MEISGFYNLATKSFSNSLSGGGGGILPTIIAGEDIRLLVRFKETRDGVIREITPVVNSMKATLGNTDRRPDEGTFKLSINAETFVTEVKFDDSTPDNFATTLQTAINALGAPMNNATVEHRNGSYIVRFPDDLTNEQTFLTIENKLHPITFIRVRNYLRGGAFEHELRFVQAPVAFTNTFELENIAAPEITVLRDGGTVGETLITEFQKLTVPPGFPGTFRVVRDGTIRSEPLSPKSTPDEIKEAMEALLDPGGIFNVTNPVDNAAYIEFDGDMAGIDFPLLTVEIFDAPAPNNVLELVTKTREMADVMQATDTTVMILEIHAEIEDPDDPGQFNDHTLLRRQVGVREAVNWDELSTAPNIDWLNPPSFVSFNVFAPSQVSSGQIHFTQTIGNGVATTFVITHGLTITDVFLTISENTTPGDHMIEGTDYTWERTSTDSVTITWLSTTPTTDQYLVTVLGLELTSFFDAHLHVISDIAGLQDFIDDVVARLSVLEATSGGSIVTETGVEEEETARFQLPGIFELLPGSIKPTVPESGKIVDIDLEETKADSTALVIGRGKGLLSASHDASVANLTLPVPAADSGNKGEVLKNNTGNRVLIPGGFGNRSTFAENGEFITSDGRLFYPVVQYGQYVPEIFTTDFASDANLFTFNDLTTGEYLPENTTVTLTTTGTLPAGSATGTDYKILTPDHEAGTFELYLASDLTKTPIILTSDGTGVHSVNVATEISYYPREFEKTLFTLYINDKQFRARKTFDLAFSFEVAVLKSNSEAQWSLMIDIGEARGVSTAGTEGVNLEEIVWRKIPALEQRLILTPSSTTHRMGVKISRRTISSVDTITIQRLLYGALEAGAVPPVSASFAIRARLGRFDVKDTEPQSDVRGFVALSGLNVISDAESEATANIEFGFGVIK